MNYWLKRLPAIRKYVFLLSTLLIAVTPVLGTCGISGCCGLRCNKLKPNDYDIELSRNVSRMFIVGVSPCPLCAQEDREWMKFVTVKDYDDEQALDDLYGKIGLQLHGVMKKEEGIGVGILCRRFVKWPRKKRIGCFIYKKEAYKPKAKKS